MLRGRFDQQLSDFVSAEARADDQIVLIRFDRHAHDIAGGAGHRTNAEHQVAGDRVVLERDEQALPRGQPAVGIDRQLLASALPLDLA